MGYSQRAECQVPAWLSNQQFTAACTLLLEERGKLKLDVPVKTYLPDAPPTWDKVTIFNLLTHTSGIPSFTEFPDYSATQATPTTPEKLVARFRDKPLNFQPGEKWEYSNSGYALLGYLIEKASGQSYSQFVQDNVFTPLGMKDSGYDSNAMVLWHRASGYTSDGGKIVNANYVAMSIPFSAGALYSTTEDLLRWEQGLMGGKLLSPASLQKMTTPFQHDYAFGVAVRTENDGRSSAMAGELKASTQNWITIPTTKLPSSFWRTLTAVRQATSPRDWLPWCTVNQLLLRQSRKRSAYRSRCSLPM